MEVWIYVGWSVRNGGGQQVNRVRLKAMLVATACAGILLGSLPIPAQVKAAGSQAKAPSMDLTALKSAGSRQAPITIEVFADYQCPQCRQFFLTTTQQLMDNYVASGKVYLIHRDFPLNMHSHSHEAALWANAAAEAGQFEAAERALYEKQDDWGATGKVEATLAGALSPADMKKVRTIEATEMAQIDAAIQRDLALGNSRQVNGTPTIFVTHAGQTTPLPAGGVNYPLLKQYLDYLLQQR
jgi:protein-disulfide isomerase